MVKDPNCQNKHWRTDELDTEIDLRIREILSNPDMAAEIAARKPKTSKKKEGSKIEKRLLEIDKQINKLMGLYQNDEIPPELLGEKINKLYNEKTALQSTIVPDIEPEKMPFDLVEVLIADASQIWEYADEQQKRRIIQSLVSKIVLIDDDIKIEWTF